MTALSEAIAAQADAAERMLEVDLSPAVERLAGAERTWLVGTGTSQHAAELGAWMLSTAEGEVRWQSAAGFAHLAPELDGDSAVLVISHTGETAFARRARSRALAAGARVVSITAEAVGWREAIETVPRERSETYTVSYVSALVVLARLADVLARPKWGDGALAQLPDAIRRAIAEPAPELTAPGRLLVLAGVGAGAITAREGALKLREAARLPAEGFEAEYLLHGSAVPLGSTDALLLLEPTRDPHGLLPAVGDAARAAGVSVVAIDDSSGLPEPLEQIPLTVRLQALASRLAADARHDPDTVITGPWADEALWEAGS